MSEATSGDRAEQTPAATPERSGEPTSALTPRRVVFGALFIAAALAGLYLLLPKIAGLNQTWGQLKHGNLWWLVAAGVLEMISVAGYAWLFHTVFARGQPRVDWEVSIQVPLAGIAAIRLLAAAGAGGVAVTAWAMTRAGMSASVLACRMVASYVLQYSVYLLALIVCGLGLWFGVFPGEAPFALTVVPAIVAAILGLLVLAMGLVPGDFERRLARLARRSGRIGRLAARFASAPATLGRGVRTAIDLVRERRVGLLGAVIYWGFDIAALGVSFRAFGTVLPVAVLVQCYFLGTLGSLLPLPGGVGGVEGGMIGAFVAFGVPGGHAVVGVLAYRAIAFWLPTIPGIGGYLALRKTVRRWQREDAQALRQDAAEPASQGS